MSEVKRKTQWQTVNSDSESNSSESSDSEVDKKAREEKKHKKDKKDKKKEKKEKKHKKDKKKHKHHKSTKVDQNEYGSFGIVKEEHFFIKQREFELYMDEVKKIPVASLGKRESYIEDFNTATMPHVKYYNLEKWEMEQYRDKRKRKHEAEDDSNIPEMFDDEELRRNEIKRAREDAQRKEVSEIKMKMEQDKELQSHMKRQTELKMEMQQAYKRGDMETVRRLDKLLKPEGKKQENSDNEDDL